VLAGCSTCASVRLVHSFPAEPGHFRHGAGWPVEERCWFRVARWLPRCRVFFFALPPPVERPAITVKLDRGGYASPNWIPLDRVAASGDRAWTSAARPGMFSPPPSLDGDFSLPVRAGSGNHPPRLMGSILKRPAATPAAAPRPAGGTGTGTKRSVTLQWFAGAGLLFSEFPPGRLVGGATGLGLCCSLGAGPLRPRRSPLVHWPGR